MSMSGWQVELEKSLAERRAMKEAAKESLMRRIRRAKADEPTMTIAELRRQFLCSPLTIKKALEGLDLPQGGRAA